MRGTSAERFLVVGWALLGSTTPACKYTCDSVFLCPVEETSGVDGGSGAGGEGGGGGAGGGAACPEDPADGIREDCGVWVSASLGDDANPGTQALPVQRLSRGIELAEAGIGRVYACGETYVEAVKLRSGISLSGGFACGKSWKHVGNSSPAILAPALPGAALTLLAGDRESTITDIEVRAMDAALPGASSIAVFSLEKAKAIFRRSHFVAGDGADGVDGEPGHHDGTPAQKGLQGQPGANACTAHPGLGGAGPHLICDAGDSEGGSGGNGGDMVAGDGQQGNNAPEPNPLGYGAGGKAEDLTRGTACTAGIGGAQGLGGLHGFGGAGLGKLTKEGYIGTPGNDGWSGTPGQGGGGGGASAGHAACGALPHGGAGGGAGGTGGCGGKPGKGGQGGGSSFGIAVLDNGIRLFDVKFTTGNGGKGGNGGTAQAGGAGGLPGIGGQAFGGAGGVKSGCVGGGGGNGGNGGHGGGGRGGHTVGIATRGLVDVPTDTIAHYFGQVGDGGKGGAPALDGATGAPGIPSKVLALEP